MTVSITSNRVTIGSHANGTTSSGSTSTTIEVTSGDIVSGDIGRFVAVVHSATDTSQTEVRQITAVSGGTITVHDAWNTTPGSGVNWYVNHNCQDVHDLADAALEKIGSQSYRWNADWSVSANGFFGDTDISLEMTKNNATCYLVAPNGIVQFGVLWGGEGGTATETTNGCRLSFDIQATGGVNVYSSGTTTDLNGGVVNYYGCLIESSTPSSTDWMFQRMRGATRFIGCIFDGPMGGAFYNEACEWIDCRMSGNDDIVPAYSMRVTLLRNPDNITFFQNDVVCLKNFSTFDGTYTNCTFADSNTDVINAEASGSGISTFIDCTTFADGKIRDTGGGTIRQEKTVNYTITDASGTAIEDALVRVNDKDDTTQASVETSNASGVVSQIEARFFEWINADPSTDYTPFRIRIREYDYQWLELQSDIDDPIKQSVALITDANVTQTSAAASAHTGISVTFEVSPVTWNSKDFSITVTGNKTTNPSLTLDDIKHYLRYNLSQSAAFAGQSSGAHIHELIEIDATVTQLGDYGGTDKGVRIIDQAGNSFTGVTQHQADDGTFYVVPTTDDFTINSSESGSLIQIFTTNTQTVIDSTTGSSLVYTHSNETVDYVVQKAGFLPQRFTNKTLSGSETVSVTLVSDPIYNASHGLTFTTDYSYAPATRIMTIVANQQGRDLYSAMIDDFISETGLRNVPFPLVAVGPDRIDFKAVGTFSSSTTVGATIDSGDIQFWKGAGMEWEHDTTGNPTKKFYSVISSNTLQTGSVVGYTQTNAGTPTEVTLVSDKVDQVIQFFEDTNGDGTADYDRNSHLLFKGFKTGYYQARWDVVNDGGASTLEPYEYTISLLQDAISGTTGDQTVTITTLTDHTSTPLVVGGKSFDYELVDPGSNTAAVLLAQYNYDVFAAVDTLISGTLYTSYNAFDLPDLVVEAGANWETEYGHFEGDGLVTDLSGVYLSRASADHPNIAKFQSNDGTYYTPVDTVVFSAANLLDSTRIRLYNVTASTLSAWQASTAYSEGDRVLATAGLGSDLGDGTYFYCSTAGTSGGIEPTWDVAAKGNTTNDNTAVWTVYPVEIDNDTVTGGSGYSYTMTPNEDFKSGDTVTLLSTYQVSGVAKQVFRASSTVTTADVTVSDSQVNWDDPGPNTLAIDGSTVSECSTDYSNIEVEISDPDDTTQKQRIAAFIVDAITTADGIRNWVDLSGNAVITYSTNTAAQIDVTVAALNVVNTKATGELIIQDTFEFDWSDGTDRVSTSTGPSTLWLAPARVLTIVSGSGVTSQDKTDIIDGVHNKTVENSESFIETTRLIRSATVGESAVSGTTYTFRDAADAKNRITATVDSNGQRTSVTTDGT